MKKILSMFMVLSLGACASSMEEQNYIVKSSDGYTVFYAFDSHETSADFAGMIKTIATETTDNNVKVVEISGYTDTYGDSEYNKGLSLRRANSVSDMLVEYGADKGKFKINSYGETNLAVPTADNVGHPQNRRTEIELK